MMTSASPSAIVRLHSTQHHAELSGTQINTMVSKLDAHLAAPDQKHFVLVLVLVPGNTPENLASFTSWPLSCATTLGRQCL
jgi:hypothetical protein